MKKIIATITLEDNRVMKVELDNAAAPLSVANFVSLAQSGFYKGLCFHRVIPNFMVQGGGFVAGTMASKKAPRTVKGEFSANGVANSIKHKVGVISMARTNEVNSASSQFFICVGDASYLDGQYAAFGCCTDSESIAVATAISEVKTTRVGHYDDVPVSPIVIKDITITEL